jgi:phosphotriesterase-related protein
MWTNGRRSFLGTLGAGALAATASLRRARAAEQYVNTVTGPIPPGKLGVTLMHEHVLVDFVGADKIEKGRYDPDEVFKVALLYLKVAYERGCRTFVDCTPAYLGRDPVLLRRLSEASGIRILTNTGYYGASGNRYLPRHAFEESADQLARRWIKEAVEGIDGTGIKPGIIKIGVDPGPLSDIHRKLARSAAIAHKATGLTIASHTGDGTAALEQLATLNEEGVSPNAFIWVHAHLERATDKHIQAARLGAWVEFEGISETSFDRQIDYVKHMIERGFLGRTLISMDRGWYHVGEPGGGQFRGYDPLFTMFVPALVKAGAGEEQIHTLLVDNPKSALERYVRLLR